MRSHRRDAGGAPRALGLILLPSQPKAARGFHGGDDARRYELAPGHAEAQAHDLQASRRRVPQALTAGVVQDDKEDVQSKTRAPWPRKWRKSAKRAGAANGPGHSSLSCVLSLKGGVSTCRPRGEGGGGGGGAGIACTIFLCVC